MPGVARRRAQGTTRTRSSSPTGHVATTGTTIPGSPATRSTSAGRPRLLPSVTSVAPTAAAYSSAKARSSGLDPAVGHQIRWRARSAGERRSRPASGPAALTSAAIGSVVTSSALNPAGSGPPRPATLPNARSISWRSSAPSAWTRSRRMLISTVSPGSSAAAARISRAGGWRSPQTSTRSGSGGVPRASAAARSATSSTSRAPGRKRSPAAVSTTPPRRRSSSCPSAASSRATRLDSACWVRSSDAAARPKCPWSTTATKARTCARSRSTSPTVAQPVVVVGPRELLDGCAAAWWSAAMATDPPASARPSTSTPAARKPCTASSSSSTTASCATRSSSRCSARGSRSTSST